MQPAGCAFPLARTKYLHTIYLFRGANKKVLRKNTGSYRDGLTGPCAQPVPQPRAAHFKALQLPAIVSLFDDASSHSQEGQAYRLGHLAISAALGCQKVVPP